MTHLYNRVALSVLAAIFSLMLYSPSVHAGWLLQPGVGGALSDVGRGLGGSLDVYLRGYWLPVPEVGIGLSASALFPLPGNEYSENSDESSRTTGVLWAGPAVILRFGNESAWGFTRAVVGVCGSISSGGTKPLLVASLGGGFVVAPRTLPFHFGFELDGALGLVGNATVRTIGLGAFIGWTF